MGAEYSFDQFLEEHFPDAILDDLGKHFCYIVGADPRLSSGYTLEKCDSNPRTGALSFHNNNQLSHFSLERILENFYARRGFNMEQLYHKSPDCTIGDGGEIVPMLGEKEYSQLRIYNGQEAFEAILETAQTYFSLTIEPD